MQEEIKYLILSGEGSHLTEHHFVLKNKVMGIFSFIKEYRQNELEYKI